MCESAALLTDLYELKMLEAYLACDLCETASFELFVRAMPQNRAFLLAAGLEQAVSFLESLRFEPADLE
jgi:nicotinate phosphoribosyltransferase